MQTESTFLMDCGFATKHDSYGLELSEREFLNRETIPAVKRDPLDDLNLTQVKERVIKEQGWDEERANNAVKWYKRFLCLAKLHPRALIIPTPDIDEIWHNHILFTREYHRDCQAILGRYLHHAPSGGESLQEEFNETVDLFQKHFGESPMEPSAKCGRSCLLQTCCSKTCSCCIGGS